jgi:hypothetical protein
MVVPAFVKGRHMPYGYIPCKAPVLHYVVFDLIYMHWRKKEKVMESVIVQQPHIEHIRKKYFSLFTVCIMDIERKVAAPDLELLPAPPFYPDDKVRSVGASYTIDLKV